MNRAPLAAIVAVSRNGVIGRDGKVPWRIPEDLKFFKRTTMGHAIIMGRKTFDEVGKPLPGRRNIVVTRNAALALPGAEVVADIETAIRRARETDPMPFVIGGAEIYRNAAPHITRWYLTEVQSDAEGDTFMPDIDRGAFREIERREGEGAVWLTLERVAG